MPKSRKVATVNDLPSCTQQSDVLDSEIGHVLRKYPGIQIGDHLDQVDLVFKDVSEFTDYADLKIQLKEAEQMFYSLPGKVREAFGNDMHSWLDAAHDREKLDHYRPKLEELGVLKPKDKPNVELDKGPLEGPANPPPADS